MKTDEAYEREAVEQREKRRLEQKVRKFCQEVGNYGDSNLVAPLALEHPVILNRLLCILLAAIKIRCMHTQYKSTCLESVHGRDHGTHDGRIGCEVADFIQNGRIPNV